MRWSSRVAAGLSRICPAAIRPKKPLPLRELAGFRADMPRLRRPAAELLREVREERL